MFRKRALEKSKDQGFPYLIRGVADTDIEIWKLRLHHVSEYHIQAFLRRCPLEALGDFGRHSWIQFHRDDLLGLLQNLRCQVSCTGTDFEDHVTLLEVGFVDDSCPRSAQFSCHTHE